MNVAKEPLPNGQHGTMAARHLGVEHETAVHPAFHARDVMRAVFHVRAHECTHGLGVARACRIQNLPVELDVGRAELGVVLR